MIKLDLVEEAEAMAWKGIKKLVRLPKRIVVVICGRKLKLKIIATETVQSYVAELAFKVRYLARQFMGKRQTVAGH